jgi:hypothetical protein
MEREIDIGDIAVGTLVRVVPVVGREATGIVERVVTGRGGFRFVIIDGTVFGGQPGVQNGPRNRFFGIPPAAGPVGGRSRRKQTRRRRVVRRLVRARTTRLYD